MSLAQGALSLCGDPSWMESARAQTPPLRKQEISQLRICSVSPTGSITVTHNYNSPTAEAQFLLKPFPPATAIVGQSENLLGMLKVAVSTRLHMRTPIVDSVLRKLERDAELLKTDMDAIERYLLSLMLQLSRIDLSIQLLFLRISTGLL